MKAAERGILMKKFTQKEIKNLEKSNVAVDLSNLAFSDKLILSDYDLQNELERIYDEVHELQTKLIKKANLID